MTHQYHKQRTIVVGDIHGCLDELQDLLYDICYEPKNDSLICVGDLIDRGPYILETIDYVMSLNAQSLCGNHEYKILRQIKNKKPFRNPLYNALTDNQIDWLFKCPAKIYVEHLNLLVVHAGVYPWQDPIKQADASYMYCRYLDLNKKKPVHLNEEDGYKPPEHSVFWSDAYKEKYNIVYGHEARREPKIQYYEDTSAYVFGIDTGCVFGNKLSALVLEHNKPISQFNIKHVYARKVYYESKTF